MCSDRIGQCLKNRQFVRLAALITLLNARPRSFSQSYPQKVGRTILSISIVCSDLSRWAGEDRWSGWSGWSGLSGLFGLFGWSGLSDLLGLWCPDKIVGIDKTDILWNGSTTKKPEKQKKLHKPSSGPLTVPLFWRVILRKAWWLWIFRRSHCLAWPLLHTAPTLSSRIYMLMYKTLSPELGTPICCGVSHNKPMPK